MGWTISRWAFFRSEPMTLACVLATSGLQLACSSADERPPPFDPAAWVEAGDDATGLGGSTALDLDAVVCSTDARPSPDEFSSDVAAFALRDEQDPPPEKPVVFTGSSSIVRWNTLAGDMAPHPVVNTGFGGSLIHDSLVYFEQTILLYDPSAVVFYAGENDLDQGVSPQCVLRDFQALVEALRAEALAAPIFFVSMKPSPARADLIPSMRRGNAYIEAFAEQTEDVEYIDVASDMLDSSGAPRPGLFVGDNLHLSDEGYALWTSLIKPELDAL